MKNGLQIVYSRISHAYFLLWCQQVLGVGSKEEMGELMEEMLFSVFLC